LRWISSSNNFSLNQGFSQWISLSHNKETNSNRQTIFRSPDKFFNKIFILKNYLILL
jgi:hypothetical protein